MGGGVPWPGPDRGNLSQVQTRRVGGGGYPGQVQMGVPEVGYPPAGMGYLPQPGQDGGVPEVGYPWQGWDTPASDGVPLAGMGYPPAGTTE